MFPFTQLSNLYTSIFYKEVKCQNPKCNIIMTVSKDSLVTHCSVSCGYEDYEQYCESIKKDEEKEKNKEYDEIYKEEYEKIKNEIEKEILEEKRNEIRKQLENDKDKIKQDILSKLKIKKD